MLQFQVVDNFNNPDLPISGLGSTLYLDSALGIWEMKNALDKSGNSKTLTINGFTFGDTGMICDGAAAHYADTGVIEPTECTKLFAFNATAQSNTSHIYTSMILDDPTVSTNFFKGTRAAILSDGSLIVDTGVVGANVVRITRTAMAGNWQIMAITTSAVQTAIFDKSLVKNTAVISNKNDSPNTVRLGSGLQTDTQNYGINGVIGLFAMYSGVLSDTTIADLIAKSKALMAARGITIA